MVFRTAFTDVLAVLILNLHLMLINKLWRGGVPPLFAASRSVFILNFSTVDEQGRIVRSLPTVLGTMQL